MSNTQLILHVKGTEQDTTTLPKHVVRAAISKGDITHSQLIWSVEDNAWKQVRELPHLLPSQKLAPAPPRRGGTGALPKVEPRSEAEPVVAVAPRAGVKVSAKQPKVAAAKARRAPVSSQPPNEFNIIKWVCVVLIVVIFGAVGFNLAMVNQPLMANLSKTSYGRVEVFGHLGAFVQTNVLLIHIPPSSQVTRENLTDFLTVLAQSTPKSPLSGVLFDHIALTPGWTGRYGFSGSDWDQLGGMQKASQEERKQFILEKLTDASGDSLDNTRTTLNEDKRQAERDKLWEEFSSAFTTQ